MGTRDSIMLVNIIETAGIEFVTLSVVRGVGGCATGQQQRRASRSSCSE
jgi:hypothetical protein